MTQKRSDNKHLHGGHRSRFKRQFLSNPSAFLDHQKLELLLFYAIPRRDTNPLAHGLINHFDSLKGVLKASPEELATVKGAGAHTVTFLHTFAAVSAWLLSPNETEGISAANGFMLEALLYSSFALSGNEQIFLACLDDRLRVAYSEVFNSDDAENGRPEFVASWLVRRSCKRFIIAKYRADGAFDRLEEQKAAYRLKNTVPSNAVLMKYMLLDNNTVTTIEI